MPKEFVACVKKGGRVITKSNGSEYVHLCKEPQSGAWTVGEVHVKKHPQAGGKRQKGAQKKIKKAPRKKASAKAGKKLKGKKKGNKVAGHGKRVKKAGDGHKGKLAKLEKKTKS